LGLFGQGHGGFSTIDARIFQSPLSMERFQNWKIMAVELVVALFGFGAVAVMTMIGYPSILAIVCMIAGIATLWLFRCRLRGISIGSGTLTMPTRQIPWMPILSFGRRTVLLSEVRR
jgi:hypothetical protein